MDFPVTHRHRLPLLSAGQAQKEVAHNEALLIADIVINCVIEGAPRADPPAEPGVGRAWIIGEAATGAWAEKAGQIACWSAAGWRFVVPFEGLHAWRRDGKFWMVFNGLAWEEVIVRTRAVEIEGVQVVGKQQPPIAEPEGGQFIDEQARETLCSLLAILRLHGLIST